MDNKTMMILAGPAVMHVGYTPFLSKSSFITLITSNTHSLAHTGQTDWHKLVNCTILDRKKYISKTNRKATEYSLLEYSFLIKIAMQNNKEYFAIKKIKRKYGVLHFQLCQC